MDELQANLATWVARLASGEVVAPADVPEGLRDHPEVRQLLMLSRVFEQLDVNAGQADADELIDAGTPVPMRCGAFRLERLLGSGGMGEVWLGVRDDGQAEQRVAVKRVRSGRGGFAERLRAERRILARLEHPNIARFIDAGVDERGEPWLAMEFVDGLPVTEWCREQGLDLDARLELFGRICAAVDHAHQQLVVHRDLKPGNVLVDTRGEPRLLDFGIAKLLDDSQSEATSSSLTPAYAAPEQLRGEPAGIASDVYALGLLLFRLLAGQLPPGRREGHLAAVLDAVEGEATLRLSDHAQADLPYPAARLRGDLDAIVAQALRAQPAARYRSAQAMAEDIARHRASLPVHARPLTRRYRLGRFLRRHGVAAGFALLAVVALMAGLLTATHQARRASVEAASARAALVRAEQVSAFLETLFREQDPLARSTSQTRTPQALLADGVARVQIELADDERGQARLLLSLAEAQHGQGMLDDAATTLDLARARFAASGGEGVWSWRVALLSALLAEERLQLPQALIHLAIAQAAAIRDQGADSVALARVQREHARLLVATGDRQGALTAANDAYALLLERLGDTHPETAVARYQRGVVREQMREDQAALEDFTAALSTLEHAYGMQDARLVSPLMSLGDVQRRLRQLDAGRATLHRAADIAARQLGAQHARHASVLARLGTLERDAGNSAAAITALEAAEAALPEGESTALAQMLATRGSVWMSEDQPARAEPDLRRAMELRKQSGTDHGLAWFSQAEWAIALAQLGRVEDAERLLREARREVALLLGPEAYQNSLIATRLGRVLAMRAQYEEAAEEQAQAERLVAAQSGPDSYSALQYRLQRVQSLAKLPDRRAQARELADTLRMASANSATLKASLDEYGLAEVLQDLDSR